jgi:hypothetical protein
MPTQPNAVNENESWFDDTETFDQTLVPKWSIPIRARDAEPGLGYVYEARVSHLQLFRMMERHDVLYSPRYQRGFTQRLGDEPDEKGWFNSLLEVKDERLNISQPRCEEMAVRWLRQDMTNRSIIWNARITPAFPDPKFRSDEKKRYLDVYSALTVPDSGHRHRALYTLVEWKLDPRSVPDQVIVDRQAVERAELLRLLGQYEPEHCWVNVTIYAVKPDQEGKIFYQANNLSKPAGPSVGYDLNRDQTPETRFITALMGKADIFAETEIERRFTRIGEKSRKATTLSTLVEAAKVMNRTLQQYERSDRAKYDELVAFVDTFFQEFAQHYPAWLSNASTADRQAARQHSYAMTNVMVHALFRLAYTLFENMDSASVDWRKDVAWKASVAKMAAKITITDKGKKLVVDPFSKDNPAWRGKILVQGFDRKSRRQTWGISNTRQTRQAAYTYVLSLAGL